MRVDEVKLGTTYRNKKMWNVTVVAGPNNEGTFVGVIPNQAGWVYIYPENLEEVEEEDIIGEKSLSPVVGEAVLKPVFDNVFRYNVFDPNEDIVETTSVGSVLGRRIYGVSGVNGSDINFNPGSAQIIDTFVRTHDIPLDTNDSSIGVESSMRIEWDGPKHIPSNIVLGED